MGFLSSSNETANKKALQAETRNGYASDNCHYAITADYLRILRGALKNELFSNGDYKKFKRNAQKLTKGLEKYIDPNNMNETEITIANHALKNLTNLASSFISLNANNADAHQVSIQAMQIKTASAKVSKSAKQCSTLIGGGRKIAGMLMIAAGLGMVIASAALAFVTFGAALPISAPLGAGGVSLTAAGILTTFGPSRIKRKLESTARLGESIAKKMRSSVPR